MSDKADQRPVFLDTNILVYQFDQTDTKKRDIAEEIIQKHFVDGRAVISSQVVQEFMNIALKKFETPMSPNELQLLMGEVLNPMCSHFPTYDFYDRSLKLFANDSLNFYDALIVQAAIDLGCSTLYTEDLQDGRMIGSMVIRNPFIQR
jgi:predicted nucleic acid-binding protein